MAARRADQGDDVFYQLFFDVNRGGFVLHGNELLLGQDLLDCLQRVDALPREHHAAFVCRLRIADGQPDGKTVHLRVRQQLRTGGSRRIFAWQRR